MISRSYPVYSACHWWCCTTWSLLKLCPLVQEQPEMCIYESEVHAEHWPPTVFLTSLTPSSFRGPDAARWVQSVLPHRAGSLMGRARKNKGFILGLGSSPLPRAHCSCFILRLPPELSPASDPRAQHSRVCSSTPSQAAPGSSSSSSCPSASTLPTSWVNFNCRWVTK